MFAKKLLIRIIQLSGILPQCFSNGIFPFCEKILQNQFVQFLPLNFIPIRNQNQLKQKSIFRFFISNLNVSKTGSHGRAWKRKIS